MRIVLVLLLSAWIGGCAQPPKSKYSERVILLPNKDGHRSTLVVKRASGEYELAAPFEAFELTAGREEQRTYAQDDVAQRYGEVLDVQPARPFTYTLFFITATTHLTPQSSASVQEVKEKIRSFPAAQVTVIGHTDRVGNDVDNDSLSFKRAASIRDMLIQIGIPREAIEVVGRGEREPLVRTADGVSEEKNRRVEIKLR